MVFFSHLLCLGRVNGMAISPPWCQFPPEGPTMAPAPMEGPSRQGHWPAGLPSSVPPASGWQSCCSSDGRSCCLLLLIYGLPLCLLLNLSGHHTCNQFSEFNSLSFCSRMASVLLVGFQQQTPNQKSHGPLFQISGDRP